MLLQIFISTQPKMRYCFLGYLSPSTRFCLRLSKVYVNERRYVGCVSSHFLSHGWKLDPEGCKYTASNITVTEIASTFDVMSCNIVLPLFFSSLIASTSCRKSLPLFFTSNVASSLCRRSLLTKMSTKCCCKILIRKALVQHLMHT